MCIELLAAALELPPLENGHLVRELVNSGLVALELAVLAGDGLVSQGYLSQAFAGQRAQLLGAHAGHRLRWQHARQCARASASALRRQWRMPPQWTRAGRFLQGCAGAHLADVRSGQVQHRHLQQVGPPVGRQVSGVRVGSAKKFHTRPHQRRVGARAHVQRLLGHSLRPRRRRRPSCVTWVLNCRHLKRRLGARDGHTPAKAVGLIFDVVVTDDDVSGVTTKLAARPGGRRLFDLLRAGDTLVERVGWIAWAGTTLAKQSFAANQRSAQPCARRFTCTEISSRVAVSTLFEEAPMSPSSFHWGTGSMVIK